MRTVPIPNEETENGPRPCLNSWGIMRTNRTPLVLSVFSAGYNSCRVLGPEGNATSANWMLVWPGKDIRPADSNNYKVPSSIVKDSKQIRYFATFAQLAEFAAKHGVTAWMRDKWGGWHPDPDGTNPDLPCEVQMGRGSRFTDFGPCDKKCKKGEVKCGQHLGVDRRADEKAAAYVQERERSQAALQIVEDARRLLSQVILAEPGPLDPDRTDGILSRAEYRSGGYTGRVSVGAEDIIALLKRLDYLETTYLG